MEMGRASRENEVMRGGSERVTDTAKPTATCSSEVRARCTGRTKGNELRRGDKCPFGEAERRSGWTAVEVLCAMDGAS